MSSSSNGPRYAPEDPTLPKPWRGLIDGETGYLYFWNPETNVTQYERPVAKPPTEKLPPPPPPKGNMPVSSSVHVQPSSGSSRHGHYRGSREVDDRDTGSRSNHHHQSQRGGSGSQSQSQANGVVYGASHGYNHGHGLQGSRSSAKQDSSELGVGLSAEAYRRQHEVTILGDSVPAPYMSFESTGFLSEILREVQHAGFPAPTPIQAQSWPIAMQARDLIAVAKTGSGKTLGYLFPGLMHLSRLRNNPKVGPTVLVLAPTRELATQIFDEAVKFGRSSKISSTCLYGGAPKGPQLRDIDRGIDVVVATPGRLNDILEMRRISLKQVSYLVLDEADRMLDMGFEPQIRKIVKEIPSRRQTLMFTATWPTEVRKIAAELLVKPIQVNIGSIDELVANKAITQYVEVIMPIEKQRRLEQILRSQEAGSKVLIFCSTKRMCDQLSRSLTRQFGAAAIHGDKSQHERDLVLGQFRTGRSPILVATDVAARGLDIKDVRVVINYDFPTGIEDYVHRIGRTGRAGATGVAYTFFSEQDSKHASDLVKVLEGADQRVPREIREMSSRGRGGGRGKFRRWAAASDGGRSRDNRNNSGYGGRDHGVDFSSFGRTECDRGIREESDRDRHGDVWGRDSKSVTGIRKDEDRDVGRGRSRSPYTNKNRGVAVRDVGRACSRSPGISKDRDGVTVRDVGRVRSRSPGINKDRGGAIDRDVGRARSRSPGINKDRGGVIDRDVGYACSRSPGINKDHSSVGDRELGHACSRSPTINKDLSGVGSKHGRSRSRSRDHRHSPSRRTHNRGKGAPRWSRSRSRGRARSPVEAMSRRSRSRSHGCGHNRSDCRSRSRSRDPGRSTERGASRSRSRSLRRVGGAFKGEQSSKDSTIAPRRSSPSDARSEPKEALHQQAENHHILEPIHMEPEQSSVLVDKHTVYVSGYGVSPTTMQDISQSHPRHHSLSPTAAVSRSHPQSTKDASRSSPYRRHSPSPRMDGSRSPSYHRLGSPHADGPGFLADHSSTSPRVDDGSQSLPHYRSSSPPDDMPPFPSYYRSSSPPDDRLRLPPYHRSSSPPDDRPQLLPYHRSSSPPDDRPQLPPYHRSSSLPDDRPQFPPYHQSPRPMEDRPRSQPYRTSPGPTDGGPQTPTQRSSDDGPRSPTYHCSPRFRGDGQQSPHHPPSCREEKMHSPFHHPSSRDEKMHSPLQWQTRVAAPPEESSRDRTSYDLSGKPANDMAGNQVDDDEDDMIIPSDERNPIQTFARDG